MKSSIQIKGHVKIHFGDLTVESHNQVTKEGAGQILNSFRQTSNTIMISHMMFLTDVPSVTDLSDVTWQDCQPLVASFGYVSASNVANTWHSQVNDLMLAIQAKVLQSINMNQTLKAAILVMNGDLTKDANAQGASATYTPTTNEKVLSIISFEDIGVPGGALSKATWDDFVAEWSISVLI